MINGEVYSVFLDGNFVGICEEEDLCWVVAQDYLNGHDTLLDDDVDRVYGYKIDVNRWQRCDHSLLCIEDKYTGKSIICSGTTEVRKAISLLNKMDLEREKAEAKIRAMTL